VCLEHKLSAFKDEAKAVKEFSRAAFAPANRGCSIVGVGWGERPASTTVQCEFKDAVGV